MIRNIARPFALALLLVALAAPLGRAFAQSSTPVSPTPNGVTGTDPEPESVSVVQAVLVVLQLP
jgi:hypothetical protein